MAQLGWKWSPQWSCGNSSAIADGAASVEDGDRERFFEIGVLQSVVHDDDIGAQRRMRFDEACACGAVAGDDDGAIARDQAGLVADAGGGVMIAIDEMRPFGGAAVAAREYHGCVTTRPEAGYDFAHKRRLAGAAGGEVSDADHRQDRDVFRRCGHAMGGERSIQRGYGRQSCDQEAGAEARRVVVPPKRLITGASLRHEPGRRSCAFLCKMPSTVSTVAGKAPVNVESARVAFACIRLRSSGLSRR